MRATRTFFQLADLCVWMLLRSPCAVPSLAPHLETYVMEQLWYRPAADRTAVGHDAACHIAEKTRGFYGVGLDNPTQPART